MERMKFGTYNMFFLEQGLEMMDVSDTPFPEGLLHDWD